MYTDTELHTYYTVAVMHALRNATGVAPDDDDMGMASACDDDLIAWADDLRDRVGLDVTDFRACIDTYIAARAEA